MRFNATEHAYNCIGRCLNASYGITSVSFDANGLQPLAMRFIAAAGNCIGRCLTVYAITSAPFDANGLQPLATCHA